jgi:hypothetical protein
VQTVLVVASLWYVIVQLRQSTKAMIASSLQEILERHRHRCRHHLSECRHADRGGVHVSRRRHHCPAALRRRGRGRWWSDYLAIFRGINIIFPAALLTGLAAGEIFRRSGSIWPTVTVHVVGNLPTIPVMVLAGMAK